MKSPLIAIHLVFVGLWLGCVLTEAIFERALLGKGRPQELRLAKLHKLVDLFIEIPAFTAVLATGALLSADVHHSTALSAKIGFGIVAILANAYCVRLVFKRHCHALNGDWNAFEKADHLQHKAGAIVLIGILAALGIGVFALSR